MAACKKGHGFVHSVIRLNVPDRVTEESSDSDGETEPAKIFHRRISTNRDIKTSVSTNQHKIN